MTSTFQVDLHGVVDLLARHLYSSPRVYLRELLQNGVDAITARRDLPAAQPGDVAPAAIRLRPLPDGSLEVADTGVGLTLAEAAELLATIGRSSKRDVELGTGREEFLGQFGIGLLSAFMVADEIELTSRSARSLPDGAAPAPVRWRGFADGSYELTEVPHEDPTVPAEPGSVVRLRPRSDMEHWLAPETVTALAQDFGSLLPVDLQVEVRLDLTDGDVATGTDGASPTVWRRLSGTDLPWKERHATPADRDAALTRYAEQTLGFTPLARIDLDLPLAGLTGVAYVLPAAVSPTTPSSHRVYLKRMLLGTRVDDLLPPWAFFVRCVLDASALRPTASREGLYEDEVLLATREALGARVREWALATLAESSPTSRAFLRVHHLAVRALALQDDDMLDLAARVLPFETTEGTGTLTDLAATLPEGSRMLWTPSVEEFRRVAPVAAAQGLGLVNGGYVYDADLLERISRRFPQWRLAPVTSDDVSQALLEVDPLRELEVADAVQAVDDALAPHDCEAVVRAFEPAALPAMLLHDRDGDHQREARATADAADDVWGQVLAELSGPARSRRLVLNDTNETVRSLLATTDPQVLEAGAQSLYVTALLLSGRPLRASEATLMNGSLGVLLDRALRPGTTPLEENR
ncbi:HSP90 family protein [Oerskovia turbata]|uniref:HSP90 family protein n=1 Tax=Oerskovia turbata TaxID=1713 RepID=A0A4Q1KZE4_9CELL|nr:HSP90 family protein [Oerskovia turbata]RXR27830.1 HSP90 family protein [Oerskovia turbata]RXR35732.1 HSP90 family protein [Oerskovia turbata]TGJ96704.1 HSP90 family protein [Actinotalea fermentans ATCC 43279 = JCM 9966 = DSM 3133]